MAIFVAVIGYLAGFCAVISFIPQAIKTIKTRNTKEISLKTYVIYNSTLFIFLLFGALSIAIPVMHPSNSTETEIIVWGVTLILPYGVTMISVTTIIFIKWQNMRKFGEHASKSHDEELVIQKEVRTEENNNVI